MSTAFVLAQAAPSAGSPFGDPSFLIVILATFAIFYFLLLRPQQQREKDRREMLGKVRRGDTVVTSGGFVATVTKVPDNSDEVIVDINDTLKGVRVLRSTLLDVRSKNEPLKDTAKT
jgi:preprotein translocase subunit YajC